MNLEICETFIFLLKHEAKTIEFFLKKKNNRKTKNKQTKTQQKKCTKKSSKQQNPTNRTGEQKQSK